MTTDITLPVFAIDRHRMLTDGIGVTTLVASHGCPLQCKYCLNPHAWNASTKYNNLTPWQLYDEVKIDDLYFLATGGGITFGGGESLLHAAFIRAFRQICNPSWRLTVETSLNVPLSHLEMIVDSVNAYIIDIKDMNPSIYQAYTSMTNERVLENLKWLLTKTTPEQLIVRVPLIPHHNTPEDVTHSISLLEEMGTAAIDAFSYIIR